MTVDPIERLKSRRGAFRERGLMGPLSGGEIADFAVRGYQALAWTFLRRTVVPTVFCVAAWLFVGHFVEQLFNTTEVNKTRQALELTIKLAMCLGVALPIFLIGVSWVTGVVTSLGADWMTNRVPNAASASRRAVQMLPRLLGAAVWTAIVGFSGSIVGLIFLFISSIIPENDTNGNAALIAILGLVGVVIGSLIALYVFIVHALVPPVIIVEGLGARAASKRSRQLVSSQDANRRNPGQVALMLTFGVTILAFFATGMAWAQFEGIVPIGEFLKTWMPGTVYNVLASRTWELVPLFLVLWLVLPMWCLGAVATYFATRVREEGYDIDVLAAEVWQQDKRARFEL